MIKKKLTRVIALCMACLGMGVFAFSGCKRNGGATGGGSGSEISGGGGGDVAVTKVEIKGNTSVKAGGKITLTAEVTPDNATYKTVTWSITAGSQFADIDSDGVLTGKAAGSVTVKATAGSVSDTYDVEVTEGDGEVVHVTGITLDKDEIELTAGETAKLTATVLPDDADDQTYSWSTDNSSAATVNNGVVTAVGAGTANITVTTTDGGHHATCTVTVKAQTSGNDPTSQGQPIVTPDNPEIKPVAGGPNITKWSLGERETAYVEWTAADSADWYNVYVSPEGAGSWTKLDGPLVRQYSEYYRADAVGLAAGTYDMKVVPVDGNGDEAAEYAATAEGLTVYAHERAGFAFVNGTSSGAYNEDGTLRTGANVIYITEKTKNTVTLDVTTNKNGSTTSCVGLQAILYAYKKALETKPLAVRFIGNITDFDEMEKGDVLIDGAQAGVTFEGIGSDATCNGWGLRIKGSSNVEVRNLGFMNCDSTEGDNVGLQQDNDHIWVHNCDMFYGDAGSDADQVKGDGALDTKKSDYVTHSYNHFWDSGKCNLQGMKDAEEKDTHVTYHHNWYDHSDSRHPRIRSATVHIYNNYFDGNAKYGVGLTYGGNAFVENNYFRSSATMRPMLISGQGTDAQGAGTFSGEDGGVIKAYGNKFDCSAANLKLIVRTKDSSADMVDFDCYTVSARSEKVPANVKAKKGGTSYSNFDTADNMYEYSVDTPDLAKEKIERYAGRLDGGDLKWDFDDEEQDGNYIVIPELKAAIVAYKTGILKIDNVDVPTGSTGGATGGGSGEEGGSTETIDGEIVLNPSGTIPSQFTMGGGASSKAVDVTIGGISVEAKKGWKMNSSGTVTFTITEDMTLTLYCSANMLKVNGESYTGTSYTTDNGVNIYKITVPLTVTDGSKQFVVSQGSGESILYLLKLAPAE